MKASWMMLAAVALLTACGGSDSTGPGGDNGNTNDACTITLSGAQTGSPSCREFSATWTSDDNLTVFGIDPSDASSPVVGTLDLSGEPTSKSYDSAGGLTAFLSVTADGDRQWVAGASLGSYTLTLTSVRVTSSSASLKLYAVHGTLTATLEPADGSNASGTVTLNVTF